MAFPTKTLPSSACGGGKFFYITLREATFGMPVAYGSFSYSILVVVVVVWWRGGFFLLVYLYFILFLFFFGMMVEHLGRAFL